MSIKTLIKVLAIVATPFVLWFLYDIGSAPTYQTVAPEPIDISRDPIQKELVEPMEGIKREGKEVSFTIELVAEYEARVQICGIREYSGWTGEMMPTDVCMLWGEMADPEKLKHIHFRMQDRHTYYHYKYEIGVSGQYITSHNANVHMVFASRNLEKAVERLSFGDRVEMKGYLVNLVATHKGMNFDHWKTSLVRTDGGDGACEIFYLTQLRIGDRLYL